MLLHLPLFPPASLPFASLCFPQHLPHTTHVSLSPSRIRVSPGAHLRVEGYAGCYTRHSPQKRAYAHCARPAEGHEGVRASTSQRPLSRPCLQSYYKPLDEWVVEKWGERTTHKGDEARLLAAFGGKKLHEEL